MPMLDRFKKWRIFWREFFFSPRLSICLGKADDDSLRIYHALHARHPRWLVIRNKTHGVALLPLYDHQDFTSYQSAVSGKNSASYYARKALREGYAFQAFQPSEHLAEIREINASASDRQGQQMDASYTDMDINYPSRSSHQYYAVMHHGKPVAYLWLQFASELVLVNRILGHADHLKHGIMYLLFVKAVEEVFRTAPQAKYMMYDTFPGASEGLRLFKKRLGFRPYSVKWRIERC